jgi:hypothetical protein
MQQQQQRPAKAIPLAQVILTTLLGEAGVALVLANARPQAPLGFWLWFGLVGLLLPLLPLWIYWRQAHEH